MKIHPDIRKFLDVELVHEPTERCADCFKWFVTHAPAFAGAAVGLAKRDFTTEQIYPLVQKGPTATADDVEKHKTLIAAIEWCVRRQKRDAPALKREAN